jgi:hypothetical protein
MQQRAKAREAANKAIEAGLMRLMLNGNHGGKPKKDMVPTNDHSWLVVWSI